MGLDTTQVVTLDGGRTAVGGDELAALADRIDGRVLGPDDDGWAEAVLIWNGMVATAPAVVVQPASTADVVAAVRFARARDLLLTVKGAGHHIAGLAVAPGALTLDMGLLRGVEVDADGRLAHVQAGCRLHDVDRATQEHGLATVLGFVSETGVAGLTLGGGFGYLTRRWGWTVDNLEEVEVVTVDGDVLIANRDRNSELFWALCGGGGNYGIVTRFTFRLHRVGPMITGGMIVWSADRVDEVLQTYRKLTEAAPRELTAACTIRKAPPAPFLPVEWHGRPIVGIVLCHSGPDAAADLAPVRDLGDPIADLVTEKPYAEQQAMLDATQPKGPKYYWKTEFLPGLPHAFLDTFRDNALEVPSPMSQSIMFHIGGALNERPADDGAVGNRDAHFVSGFASSWPVDGSDDEHVAWARRGWEAIRPFSTGGNYINFQTAEDDVARTAEAYGANLERLRRVKATHDPDNFLRVNRNITP